MTTSAICQQGATPLANDEIVLSRYQKVRQRSQALCEPLEIEDYGLQVMAAASPPKWHLAHTAWFFETLLLKPYLPGYKVYHPLFSQLFNSYYETIGRQHPRAERGYLSRPTVAEVYDYRHHVDEQMVVLLSQTDNAHGADIKCEQCLGLIMSNNTRSCC